MAQPARYTDRHLDLAYERSTWEDVLWTERLDRSRALGDLTDGLAQALTDHREDRGDDLGDYDAAHARSKDVAGAFGGELFARLYNDPAKRECEADHRWADRAHGLVDELPEFAGLRGAVAGDPDFAALAARDLLEAVGPRMPDLLDQVADEDAQGAPQGSQGRSDGSAQGETTPSPQDAPQGEPTASDAFRAAARRAARAAEDRAMEGRELLNGLLPGLGHVPAQHEQRDPGRMDLVERLRGDRRFLDILQRVGRLRRIAAKAKRVRSQHAREEVVDVERGADLSRVLPSQLAGLRGRLRPLVLRGLVERSLVQYRLEGSEPLGRGPIVVILDESVSMQGNGHDWARAIGVACIGIGAQERRPVTVIGFDTEVRYEVIVDAAGRATLWTTSARPEPVDRAKDAALYVLQMGVGGGTDFAPALRRALDAGLEQDRADFVFVSDGQAHVPEGETMDRLLAARGRGLRVFGLTVNGGSVSPTMAAVCDQVVDIDRAQDADGEVAGCLP